MVQVLNFNEQVKVTTMKPYQVLDYNQFFKLLCKFPQSGTINRTHIFVAEMMDGRNGGLIFNDHIELI